jgi:hypothetical protein
MAQFKLSELSATSKAAAEREFNNQPLSRDELIAKGKAQAALWAAKAVATAADTAAVVRVVAGQPPVRDSAFCPDRFLVRRTGLRQLDRLPSGSSRLHHGRGGVRLADRVLPRGRRLATTS